MVLACWCSVSAAVGSLFLGRAAAMQGEHYYVLTSLLIVYAGQHAAFKDEIGPSRAHLDARADSRKGAITLRRRRRSPSGSPRGLRVAIVSFSFCLLNLFCLKVPLTLAPSSLIPPQRHSISPRRPIADDRHDETTRTAPRGPGPAAPSSRHVRSTT